MLGYCTSNIPHLPYTKSNSSCILFIWPVAICNQETNCLIFLFSSNHILITRHRHWWSALKFHRLFILYNLIPIYFQCLSCFVKKFLMWRKSSLPLHWLWASWFYSCSLCCHGRSVQKILQPLSERIFSSMIYTVRSWSCVCVGRSSSHVLIFVTSISFIRLFW